MGGRMDIRGVYGFSSLVKQNKKLKFTLSFASPEKENYFFNICDVITSPEKEKSSANHYSRAAHAALQLHDDDDVFYLFFQKQK